MRSEDRYMLVWAMLAAIAAGLVACRPERSVSPSRPGPSLDGISSPIDRIPPRQEIIKDLVPDVPLAVKQADATIADAQEARAAVVAARDDMQARIDRLGAELAAEKAAAAAREASLQRELERERDTSTKRFRMWVNALRFGCLLGIAAGIVLAVVLKRPALVVISLASVVTNAAIAIDGFTWTYGMPIAAGTLVVLLIVGAWCLFTRQKATEQLVKSGEAMLKRIPGGVDAVALELNRIQSSSTRKLVDLVQSKPTPVAPHGGAHAGPGPGRAP